MTISSLFRTIVLITAVSFCMTSCTQKDVTAPVTVNRATSSAPVSYSDSSISINGLQASQVSSTELAVSFSVEYTSNVTKIELMSGATANNLGSIYSVDMTGDKSTSKTFTIDDTNIKGSTMNYMIKFTLTDGNWGYTPVYSLQMKQ